MRRFSLIVLATLSAVRIAAAHPGHGDPGRGFSPAHHLTEPLHILAALAFVAGVLAMARFVRRRQRS